MSESRERNWKFHRLGGFNQVSLESGEDLKALDTLDLKLWAALSCPTRGLDFDEKTMDLIDADDDGRVRAPELISATKWTLSLIQNADTILEGSDTLALAEFDTRSEEGLALLNSAKQILDYLGKPDAKSISLDDTSDSVRIFKNTLFNGDGVVPTDSANTDETRATIEAIMACFESIRDRGGKPGINQAKVDRFFEEAQAYSDWIAQSEANSNEIFPLGIATAQAYEIYQEVEAKIDDFFTRRDLASYDPRTLDAIEAQEVQYLNTVANDLIVDQDEFAKFPIAQASTERSLPLKSGVNPAWMKTMDTFVEVVVGSILGKRDTLSANEWKTIRDRLAAHGQWRECRAGETVESIGLDRLRTLLAGPEKQNIEALIERDLQLANHANSIERVDNLLRLNKNLFQLLNNFVSLRDFYDPERLAIFQQGTLYLDGRSCELCVLVRDPKKHATLAPMSRCYLAYCECTRPGETKSMTIAAAFMNGASDFLTVGRNGIFIDRFGRDWDATIIKSVENPISLRQAFWSPYKRISKIVEDQFQNFAAAREKSLLDGTKETVGSIGSSMENGSTSAGSAFDIARFAGVFAAIGLAIGTLGAAFAAVMNGLLGLPLWQLPLVLIGSLLLVSGPPILLAYMKLRQRNLAPLLDANGWAINARARINVPFGASLTRIAQLPKGSKTRRADPYRDKSKRGLWVVVILLAAYLFAGKVYENGTLHNWTNGALGSQPSIDTIEETKATP